MKTNLFFALLVCPLSFLTMSCDENSGKINSSEALEAPVQDIKWTEIAEIYGEGNKTTDLKKKMSWEKYKGKRVKWSGTVNSIDTMLGQLLIQIRMGRIINTDGIMGAVVRTENTLVNATLEDSQQDKAVNYAEGDDITIEGTLSDWGDMFIENIDLEHAIIID